MGQSDVKALQTELDDARLRVETAEADRNAMRAEHDGLVTQLRALQLAHAGLCAAHAELQIREAHQKEQTGVQAAELLTLQRELTQHRLADSAVEAREASRRLEIAKLRAELAEARERLEQTEACAAAVARAGVDPVTLRANHSEITQATIEILRDQLQSTLTRSAGTGAGLAAAAAATTEGNRAELKVGNGGGAGPMVLGMLLGNLDKGAEIAQHHPDLLDLVQQWAGGGSLPPDKVQATVLKAGLDPEVAQKIQVASVLLSTTDSGGLNPEGLGAILTLASSVDSAQLEQLVRVMTRVSLPSIGTFSTALSCATLFGWSETASKVDSLVKTIDPQQQFAADAECLRRGSRRPRWDRCAPQFRPLRMLTAPQRSTR